MLFLSINILKYDYIDLVLILKIFTFKNVTFPVFSFYLFIFLILKAKIAKLKQKDASKIANSKIEKKPRTMPYMTQNA